MSIKTIMAYTPHPFKEHSVSATILMIDDDPAFGKVIEYMLKDEEDFHLFIFQDPFEALKRSFQIKPTVILLDFRIPGIDGLQLVKTIRDEPRTRHIPIIMLSSHSNPETKSQLFELGVNDYIVKPPEKVEFLARIRYHSEAYTHLLERNETYQALLESQKTLKDDIKEAEYYIRSLLPDSIDQPEIKANWEFHTSRSLGGDSLGYHWIDLDHFAMYLIDVSGHGVGAALLSVSVLNTLRSQTLSGVDFTDPSKVLKKLNETFRIEQHNELYFTIWYGVYSKTESTLTYATGGHPPAVLLREEDSTTEAMCLSTPNPIIGVVEDLDFKSQSIGIKPNDKLYIFSDGVYEIDNKDGSGMIHLKGFIEALQCPPPLHTSKLESLVEYCQEVQGKKSFNDDFSLIEILFH